MIYRILFIILASASPAILSAQRLITIPDSITANHDINVSEYVSFYNSLTEKKNNFNQIKNELFRPLNTLNQQNNPPSSLSEIIIWLKLSFDNKGTRKELLLDLGKQGEIELYSDSGRLLQRTGAYYYPYNAVQWQPILLQPDSASTQTFIIKVLNRTRKGPYIIPILHNRQSLANHLNKLASDDKKNMAILFFIDGFLLIMSLFAIVQYIIRRDRLYLYYAVFCIAGSLMILWNINSQFAVGFPLHFVNASQVFAYLIAIFYALFLKEFIGIDKQFPKTWVSLKFLILILCFQLCISIYENYFGLLFTSNFYYLKKSYTILAINIILFVCLLFSKSSSKKLLIIGASFLWVPNFIVESSIISTISNTEIKNLVGNTLAGAAVLLENFLFLVALSFWNYKLEKERNEMQEKYADELKIEIESKAKEIEKKQELLQQQNIKNIEDKHRHQITETEMAALKAQMNPHFMFNCINSIDSFIQTNDKYSATLYLNKFAKLIRNVLDSSKQNVVSFSKDIETLKLYIELEELRSDNKFKINLNIDDELMSDDFKVPPLIMQPFVENAIIHGLKNREDNTGLLSISIQKENNSIHYSIKDNGIGRLAAAKIAQNKDTHFGMQMSYDRIKLFNKEANPSVVIADLFDGPQATGTKIDFYLNIV